MPVSNKIAVRLARPLALTMGVALGASACASGSADREVRSAALDRVAAETVELGFPGVTIATACEGGPIYTAAAGSADLARDVAMTPGSPIHAASTTKAETAAAALILIDRGSLSLDTRLPELLPASLLEGIPHAADIDVRDLLLHTSGLYSPNNDPVYLARYIGPERLEKSFWSAEETVAFAADPSHPPAFAPGEGQSYSDVNYVLLSLIVSERAKRPFKTFVREEILEPLGMTSTWYLSDDPGRPRARGYTVDSEIIRSIGLDPGLVANEQGLIDTSEAQEQSDGAAGLITTTSDLVRFARAFLLADLLSPSSRELVLAVAEQVDEPGEQGLGVLRAYRMPHGPIVTAEGDGPGTNVVWALQLETRCLAAAAVNLFGRWDESEVLLETVLPAALAAVGLAREIGDQPCADGRFLASHPQVTECSEETEGIHRGITQTEAPSAAGAASSS